QLEAVEVVEAVDEDRAPPPGRLLRRAAAQRVQRATRVQLLVKEAGLFESVAVGAVDRRNLVRVPAAGAVGRPVAERAREAGGAHLVANLSQLGEEMGGGAHEARLRGRFH